MSKSTRPHDMRRPLADILATLTDEDHEVLALARRQLGRHPMDSDVVDFFAAMPLNVRRSVRNAKARRLKRVFWATVGVDSRNLRLARKPITLAVSVGRRLPQGYPCVYCGSPAEEIDHVWPRARGGDDHPNNLVAACGSCNAAKGSRSILDDPCPTCGHARHPGDVDTSTGTAYYSCRCGSSWSRVWNLQAVPFAA